MKRVSMQDVRKTDYYYEEAIKTLLTNIKFAGKDVKTILLTSCYPNEGKSDITFSGKRNGSVRKKGSSPGYRYEKVYLCSQVSRGRECFRFISVFKRTDRNCGFIIFN